MSRCAVYIFVGLLLNALQFFADVLCVGLGWTYWLIPFSAVVCVFAICVLIAAVEDDQRCCEKDKRFNTRWGREA